MLLGAERSLLIPDADSWGTRDCVTALGEMGLERGEKIFPSTRNKYLGRQFSSQEKEKVRRSHEMPVRTMADMIEGVVDGL
jgi:hypothetical protein